MDLYSFVTTSMKSLESPDIGFECHAMNVGNCGAAAVVCALNYVDRPGRAKMLGDNPAISRGVVWSPTVTTGLDRNAMYL